MHVLFLVKSMALKKEQKTVRRTRVPPLLARAIRRDLVRPIKQFGVEARAALPDPVATAFGARVPTHGFSDPVPTFDRSQLLRNSNASTSRSLTPK